MILNDATFVRSPANPILTLEHINWPAGYESIMFPCVVDMRNVAHSRDAFYLYYATHSGNGIGLATAGQPEGPWRPWSHNPVLTLEDVPGTWRHLSSPHAVVSGDEVRLYFHAPWRHGALTGQMTGLAISRDGIRFEPCAENPVLPTGDAGQWDCGTASYLRVLPWRGGYLGMYMGHDNGPPVHPGVAAGRQGLAFSDDGIAWTKAAVNPVLAPLPPAGEYGTIRHAALLPLGGSEQRGVLVFYSTRPDSSYSREVLRLATMRLGPGAAAGDVPPRIERYGTLLRPQGGWEGTDLRDPYALVVDSTLYLFYAGGRERGIGVAKAEASTFAAGEALAASTAI